MALCYYTEEKMISNQISSVLEKNILKYDLKNNHDYLIAFTDGRARGFQICEITFRHFNFWHLLGCKVKSVHSLAVYEACKNSGDIHRDIELLYGLPTFYEKDRVFNHVFDFVANAKSVKIGYTNIGPEQFQLTMAIGSHSGIIGYDVPKAGNQRFLFPKSAQEKQLTKVSDQIYKIVFIISKASDSVPYNRIEYEIKQGLTKRLIKELPDRIAVKIQPVKPQNCRPQNQTSKS